MKRHRTPLVLAVFLFAAPVQAEQVVEVPHSSASRSLSAAQSFPLPVYHIPLRIHLSKSRRSATAFLPILEEINEIWLSQAGICFEMEVVTNDDWNQKGIDLWFEPILDGGEGVNGYYWNPHDIFVRDTPNLGQAPHPARYPAARTAAHELGHSLGLLHRQDSDDNLMRSKTSGWKLNADEIARARRAAKAKALAGRTEVVCGPVRGTK